MFSVIKTLDKFTRRLPYLYSFYTVTDEEMDAVYLESTKSLQVRDEWQKLGSKLGIDQQILNQISQENSALYETCLAVSIAWDRYSQSD